MKKKLAIMAVVAIVTFTLTTRIGPNLADKYRGLRGHSRSVKDTDAASAADGQSTPE